MDMPNVSLCFSTAGAIRNSTILDVGETFCKGTVTARYTPTPGRVQLDDGAEAA